jgi:hypothetical protein
MFELIETSDNKFVIKSDNRLLTQPRKNTQKNLVLWQCSDIYGQDSLIDPLLTFDHLESITHDNLVYFKDVTPYKTTPITKSGMFDCIHTRIHNEINAIIGMKCRIINIEETVAFIKANRGHAMCVQNNLHKKQIIFDDIVKTNIRLLYYKEIVVEGKPRGFYISKLMGYTMGWIFTNEKNFKEYMQNCEPYR